MCKDHGGFQFLLDKLAQLKIIDFENSRELMASITYDHYSKKCMYRECETYIIN